MVNGASPYSSMFTPLSGERKKALNTTGTKYPALRSVLASSARRRTVWPMCTAPFTMYHLLTKPQTGGMPIMDSDASPKAPKVHGILVQLPLPKHIDEKKVLNAIDPDKDVDGFHPVNVGRLMIGGKEAKFLPCTPAGIQELIVRSGFETSGAEVVVVGRSNIVGKPIANIMLQKGRGANSTVTIVHTGTKNLDEHCKRADILIVAAGVPGLVKPAWIKPGACVIDVGVNRVGEKKSEKTGKMVPILKGDVDFDAAKEIAGAITPVPGGVGPMTITMLMKNTVKSAKLAAGLQ